MISSLFLASLGPVREVPELYTFRQSTLHCPATLTTLWASTESRRNPSTRRVSGGEAVSESCLPAARFQNEVIPNVVRNFFSWRILICLAL